MCIYTHMQKILGNDGIFVRKMPLDKDMGAPESNGSADFSAAPVSIPCSDFLCFIQKLLGLGVSGNSMGTGKTGCYKERLLAEQSSIMHEKDLRDSETNEDRDAQ